MQIFVRSILNKTFVIDINKDDTILDIKNKVYNKDAFDINKYYLMYGSKRFNDSQKLSDINKNVDFNFFKDIKLTQYYMAFCNN